MTTKKQLLGAVVKGFQRWVFGQKAEVRAVEIGSDYALLKFNDGPPLTLRKGDALQFNAATTIQINLTETKAELATTEHRAETLPRTVFLPPPPPPKVRVAPEPIDCADIEEPPHSGVTRPPRYR